MKITIKHIAIAGLVVIGLSGCGMFKSTTKVNSRTDSSAVETKVTDFSEFESLQADIPAAYIKSITTPSGIKIELRDSISTDSVSKEPGDKKNKEIEPKEHSSEPSISLSYNRGQEASDSVFTKTEKEQKKSEIKESKIETGLDSFTWIIIGIAIALALILAAVMFFKGSLPFL